MFYLEVFVVPNFKTVQKTKSHRATMYLCVWLQDLHESVKTCAGQLGVDVPQQLQQVPHHILPTDPSVEELVTYHCTEVLSGELIPHVNQQRYLNKNEVR